MSTLYHIVPDELFTAAREAGWYRPAAFAEEGFVHCSYAHQVESVAAARFRGQRNLVLLAIDATALSVPVIDENLEGGEQLFPHVYGVIPVAAITAVHAFPCNSDGLFTLPADL